MTQPLIKHLGIADYQQTFDAMRAHNRAITNESADEIWLLEHPPVFTQGLAGKAEHILDAGDVPVVKIDRGGQATYHGPGQLVVYLLLNMRRRSYGVKSLVSRIEQSVIDLLAEYGIAAERQASMPGVYVETASGIAKIAAIGLRVANHATYHGLSLNVDMDLAPFSRINPCGYEGLATTQMSDWDAQDKMDVVGEKLLKHLKANLYG
ncbi:MAG: lipoyl(octanoyl) transferase LipB [Rhodocyclaceae bacterium]|nr:lipoyl(octanoyl) transferase LipB [Rhodocyclaceae bacterium]MCA3084167.1 lipoyl(octanoyl) transferase LipB [Rhodocyclaceae bacterium]